MHRKGSHSPTSHVSLPPVDTTTLRTARKLGELCPIGTRSFSRTPSDAGANSLNILGVIQLHHSVQRIAVSAHMEMDSIIILTNGMDLVENRMKLLLCI